MTTGFKQQSIEQAENLFQITFTIWVRLVGRVSTRHVGLKPDLQGGAHKCRQECSTTLGYRPKNPVSLNDAEREEVEAFLDAIDADDDVQNVYAGLVG